MIERLQDLAESGFGNSIITDENADSVNFVEVNPYNPGEITFWCEN